jgi:hypothetical protein
MGKAIAEDVYGPFKIQRDGGVIWLRFFIGDPCFLV